MLTLSVINRPSGRCGKCQKNVQNRHEQSPSTRYRLRTANIAMGYNSFFDTGSEDATAVPDRLFDACSPRRSTRVLRALLRYPRGFGTACASSAIVALIPVPPKALHRSPTPDGEHLHKKVSLENLRLPALCRLSRCS